MFCGGTCTPCHLKYLSVTINKIQRIKRPFSTSQFHRLPRFLNCATEPAALSLKCEWHQWCSWVFLTANQRRWMNGAECSVGPELTAERLTWNWAQSLHMDGPEVDGMRTSLWHALWHKCHTKLFSSVPCRRFPVYEIGYYGRVISSFECLRDSGDRYDLNNKRIGTDI